MPGADDLDNLMENSREEVVERVEDILETDCYDSNNGALDDWGDDCSSYEMIYCGMFDNDDFDSATMCCLCGGGSTSAPSRLAEEDGLSRLVENDESSDCEDLDSLFGLSDAYGYGCDYYTDNLGRSGCGS